VCFPLRFARVISRQEAIVSVFNVPPPYLHRISAILTMAGGSLTMENNPLGGAGHRLVREEEVLK
jgi:hypothetical protein